MKLFLALTMILPLISRAQDTAISYTNIIQVDSVSKGQLYTRARMWVNDAFKSGKSVVQIEDKDAGQITGTGWLVSEFLVGKSKYPGKITFDFKIFTKDGKYKYLFDNFFHEGIYSATEGKAIMDGFGLLTTSKETKMKGLLMKKETMNKNYQSIKDGLEVEMKKIIASLYSSMQTSSDF